MPPLSGIRRVARPARGEEGSSLVEGLLALGLVTLAFSVGVEAVALVQARTLAAAAAQEGARSAALAGAGAGLAAADRVLAAGGGLGRGLAAAVDVQQESVSATVQGRAPDLFGLGFLLPEIRAQATAPAERYPAGEAAA